MNIKIIEIELRRVSDGNVRKLLVKFPRPLTKPQLKRVGDGLNKLLRKNSKEGVNYVGVDRSYELIAGFLKEKHGACLIEPNEKLVMCVEHKKTQAGVQIGLIP